MNIWLNPQVAIKTPISIPRIIITCIEMVDITGSPPEVFWEHVASQNWGTGTANKNILFTPFFLQTWQEGTKTRVSKPVSLETDRYAAHYCRNTEKNYYGSKIL